MAREKIAQKRNTGTLVTAPEVWREWLPFFFPRYVSAPFAQRHVELWEWIESLRPNVRPRPFVGIWPRGGAKSSTAELGVVDIARMGTRKYAWYISETQELADKHVDTIGGLLENEKLSRYYPKVTSRALSKYGSSKGWRRSRLRTASRFTVDAMGLDTAGRGSKVDDARPDIIILDDIDDKYDSPVVTMKKLGIISSSILPAGSTDLAVLFVQNLIHPDSIASRIVDGRADIISDRILSGPFKAVENLTYSQVGNSVTITGGTPTWEGQNLQICQDFINTWGLTAFLEESQHEVDNIGGKWGGFEWRRVEWSALPSFVKVAVWVDPAVTSTDDSDCQGICAGALGVDMKKYMLYSWEGILSPEAALEQAIEKAMELGAETVGVETDQGGDTWESVYKQACENLRRKKKWARTQFPRFTHNKAGGRDELTGHAFGSKVARNDKMHASYERGEVIHAIGTHTALEKALLRHPIKPLDLADAAFWVWYDLETTAVSDEDLEKFGRDEIDEDDLLDEGIIEMYADTMGISIEAARAELEKEAENEKRKKK